MGQLTALVLDTLSAFCVVISPHHPNVAYWSQWGGKIVRAAGPGYVTRDTLIVDGNERNARVTNIVFHPTNPDIMFAGGMMMQGVYRSTDGGQSWQVVHRLTRHLEWFGGESISSLRPDYAFGFVASSLTNGNLLVSDSDGEHWMEWQLCGVVASCSIMVPALDPTVVLVGSRDGKILKVEIATGREEVVWSKVEPYYIEVPRFHQSVRDPYRSYAVTVGFDTAKRGPGLLRSTDGGSSFEGVGFPGISFWAIDERQSNGDLILGGFSEFAHFPGAGLLYVYSERTGVVSRMNIEGRWDDTMPSCWDLAISRDDKDELAFLVATESGVYFVSSSERVLQSE